VRSQPAHKPLLAALAVFLLPVLAEAPRAPSGLVPGTRSPVVVAPRAVSAIDGEDVRGLGLAGRAGVGGVASAPAASPRLMLWAWERPENLRFLDPRRFGVAALVATITLQGDGILTRPRFEPLALPPRMRVIAVVRIEIDPRLPPTWSAGQREDLVTRVVSLTAASGVPMAGVQIDFDAPRSARPFYRTLLTDLRNRLPDELPLSMTAVASWCLGDRWVEDLPVDEIVPMVFRPGTDARRVQEYLAQGHAFTGRCADAIGLATDEYPTPFARSRSRIYVFHPSPWTPDDVDALSENLSP